MRNVFAEIIKEQERQVFLFGKQDHSPHVYYGILAEEVGEVAMAMNDSFDFKTKTYIDLSDYREELVQVAAVAISMIQSLDRKAE
jgi:NTP pyrophosphatase (non-canonical NTP hydrolase)